MHKGDLHETAEGSLFNARRSAVILFLSLTSSDYFIFYSKLKQEEKKQGKTKCDSQDQSEIVGFEP